MTHNVLASGEALKHPKLVGSKTINLARLLEWGFAVPNFVALPTSLSERLLEDQGLRQTVVDEIIAALPCERYAVRSSALIEDSEQQSFAGQLHTETDVASSELGRGIEAVLEQANDFLRGDLKRFSMIIQRYIAPDLAGVTFTRNPSGSRDMVIEYGAGAGEQIVGGAIKPETLRLFHSEAGPTRFTEVIKSAKELEQRFGFPQDIEWCMQGAEFYLLQTRPITTLGTKAYEQIQALERLLPKNQLYFFEKTELTEVAPRPTPLSLDILRRVYAQGGPVDRAYTHFGVRYTETDFLRVIGNELYVDKEQEIRGLLPSYSYLAASNFTPRFAHLSGAFQTVQNMVALAAISTKGHTALFAELKQRLEADDSLSSDCQSALDLLLTDYELVFRVNLLSGLSLKKLTVLLGNEPLTVPQLIESSALFVDWNQWKVAAPESLQGNSFDITDKSTFVAANPGDKRSPAVSKWWQYLSSNRRALLGDRITEALVYNRLRELGRWLMLKRLSSLRTLVLTAAKTHGYTQTKDIYFARLADVLAGRASQAHVAQTARTYRQFDAYTFPAILTSTYAALPCVTQGVSAGIARGVLSTVDQLKSDQSTRAKPILYTQLLTPDLTQYFDKITGIVSERGGLLSHLAIVAREHQLPVVIGYTLTSGAAKIGDAVEIDGSNGTIAVIENSAMETR